MGPQRGLKVLAKKVPAYIRPIDVDLAAAARLAMRAPPVLRLGKLGNAKQFAA
jgi:hypothetical protein